ncbi:hypothetical protein [Staphylococcus delphini]|uniref:Phage protein n=1 Tax=Staphylococcus delphini TaxID=53344 RepID=A0AAX0QTX7_9STAP|nr:hypothetical protein [Staphylococcus delphini]PCF50144.1 hypothetical protein B5C07_08020 [Staphylococcus delphini]PNZ95765.1 hypothetical protein CD148_03560 [Staphylococcus delphini]RIZ56224.1 hypothetical protein CDL68_01405 [Staphylococcus delphini]VED62450.1 Uncharacterised protein [Staphylococcus delphini]
MEDKKYIKIEKDENNKFYYEVSYLTDYYGELEIAKSSFFFKDVLTPTRLNEFENELKNAYFDTEEVDTNETYTTYTLYDLIKKMGMFEEEPKTYFDMMLKSNEIINNEVRQHSDVDKYDVQFFESEREFEDVECFESEFPNVNYSKPIFVISYIENGGLIKVLNASKVKSYKDLTNIIEDGGC